MADAAEYTQEGRQLVLECPSLKNKLLLTQFDGREEVSRLFSFQLQMLSQDHAISAQDIVGKDVLITLKVPDDTERIFHGKVASFAYCGTDDRFSHYTAEVVPWLWFLTLKTDCRIFQEMSVPEIIEQVFGDLGFSDFETSELKETHARWTYCVQYRESDFNFVSRLMEQEGIFYYFRHEQQRHVLVLADQMGAFKDCPENQLEIGHSRGAPESTDKLTGWEHHYQYRSGKSAQTDYNFETPSADLLTQSGTVVKWDQVEKYEVFEYPGEYTERSKGEAEVKMRMEEIEVAHDTVDGAGVCRGFVPGGKFKITKHPSKAEEGKTYGILAVSHAASEGGTYVSGGSAAFEYRNTFTCIPVTTTFRPARTTRKPFVQGVQPAVVVGPPGEEIHTDEHGRVKVQFFWDRRGQRDDKSSCWIRVSHPWAGQGWGSMATPRIGQEVLVGFFEGDPDRPVITGRVYNAEQAPPYAAGQGVVSGLKSQTHKGSGSNEMSMDDTAGQEKITIHAQYDMGTTVEHDDTQTVHNNRTITVDGTHTETIKKDTTIKITEGNLDHDVVAGTSKAHVQGAVTEKYDNKQETTVANEIIIKSTGSKIYVEAATEITLKVGASKLWMDSGGKIELSGNDIAIKGTANVEIKGGNVVSVADANNEMKGAAVLSEGSATNTVKGGVVMLNP